MTRRSDTSRRAGARRTQGLRRRAETLARETNGPRQADHDLRVHQIELELQNEELRRTQAELDAARSRYFDLYDLAPVGYCTLSHRNLILEANFVAATLLGVPRAALAKQPLTRFILPDDQDLFYRLRKRLQATVEPRSVELRLIRPDGTHFWAHLEATSVSDAATGAAPACRVVLSDISERKRADLALLASRAELQALTRRLVALEEAARREVACHLHDRVGQNLTALSLNLAVMEGLISRESAARVRRCLDDSLQLLAEAMASVRDVMADFRPPLLDDYGIASALRCYVTRAGGRSNMRVVFSGGHDVGRIPADAEVALFRIAQEAITNAARHAQASEVRVTLASAGHGVRMRVADDGVGFEVGAHPGAPSWGVTIMRERAEAVGATLRLESSPGAGTTVTVDWPGSGSPPT